MVIDSPCVQIKSPSPLFLLDRPPNPSSAGEYGATKCQIKNKACIF